MYLIFVAIVLSLLSASNAIGNGHTAERGEFPYYAHLQMSTGVMCGGALIDSTWILTAANCFRGAGQIKVHLGKSQLNETQNGAHLSILGPQHIHIHPAYKRNDIPGTNLHDIALVRLPRPVKDTVYIQAVRLPATCDSHENVRCDTMGNGIRANGGRYSAQLYYATFKTLLLNECRELLSAIGTRTTILCANNAVFAQPICKGDSGGPLVRESDDTLIGVSGSTKANDCMSRIPHLFTNVNQYLKWIGQVTGLKLPKCHE